MSRYFFIKLQQSRREVDPRFLGEEIFRYL